MSGAARPSIGKRKQRAGVVSAETLFLNEMIKLFPSANGDTSKLRINNGEASNSVYVSVGGFHYISMGESFKPYMHNAPTYEVTALWIEMMRTEESQMNIVVQIIRLMTDEVWKRLSIRIMENVESLEITPNRVVHLKLKHAKIEHPFKSLFLRKEKSGFRLFFTPKKMEWSIPLTENKTSILISLLQVRTVSSISQMTAELEREKVKLALLNNIL